MQARGLRRVWAWLWADLGAEGGWGVGLVKIFPLSEAAVNKHLKWGGHLKPKDKTEAELSKAISPEASQGLNRGA